MLKKLLIAAVAVIAGMVVLAKTTGVCPSIWLKDCCKNIRNSVPPETKLKQLKAEIDNIDRDINKNLSRLAHLRVQSDQFEAELQAKRDRQAALRADMRDIDKLLDEKGQSFVFHGRRVGAEDLSRRLDMATTEFNCLKEQIKVHEQCLAEKKRTLEAAMDRITEMKNAKEKLRVTAARLETHLELVKMKQIQNKVVDFDESAVSQAQQTAQEIETQLRVAEETMKLKTQFGYAADKNAVDKGETKSKDEVRKAARAALQDNESVDLTNKAIDIDNRP
jgi:chromosome segregation ATPase